MIAVAAEATPRRSTRAPHARVPTLTSPPDDQIDRPYGLVADARSWIPRSRVARLAERWRTRVWRSGGVVSRRVSRSVAGRRAGPRRGTRCGAVFGDGPRHGVPVRARPAQDVDRDAARRQPQRRPRDPLADVLRMPALPFRLHHGRARHSEVYGDSSRRIPPGHVRVGREVLRGSSARFQIPTAPGPCVRFQVAGRFPKMVRETRPHLAAACEVAGMLAARLGLSRSVSGLLAHLVERWDGRGPLGRAKREEIPLSMRIVHLAVDAAFQRLLGGEERVVRLVRERAGHAFDPQVAACLAGDAAGSLRSRPRRRCGRRRSRASRIRGCGSRARRSIAVQRGQLRRSDPTYLGVTPRGWRSWPRRRRGAPDRRSRVVAIRRAELVTT